MSGRVPPPMKPVARKSSSVQRQLFRQQRFWMRLAAYRPLAVLASIWIGLLAIALLAFGQLTHSTSDEPTPKTSTATPEVYPHERMRQNAEPDASPPETVAEGDRESPAPATDTSEPQTVNGLSPLTLAALVGSCAGGCWLLSVLIKMPRRPKKRRPKSSGNRKKYRLTPPEGAKSALASPAAPKASTEAVPKLDAYDPDQPLVAPSKTNTPPNPRPATNTQPATPTAPADPPATAAASDVSVVSDQVQHRLDWPNDSLVNTADVRQRRSLSSYM